MPKKKLVPKYKSGDKVLLKPRRKRTHRYHPDAEEWEKYPTIIDRVESIDEHRGIIWYYMIIKTGHRYREDDLRPYCKLKEKRRKEAEQ